MSTKHLLEPELHKLAEAPREDCTSDAIALRRREERRASIKMGDAAEHGVRRTEIWVDGHGFRGRGCGSTSRDVKASNAHCLHHASRALAAMPLVVLIHHVIPGDLM